MLTATAPAIVRFPLLVEALLSASVVSLLFAPPLESDPPGEDFAIVVIERSDVAVSATPLPVTLAVLIQAWVSP